MLDAGMKVRAACCENTTRCISLTERKESQDGVIRLDEDHPEVVNAMLYYIYNFDYVVPGEEHGIAPMVFDIYVHTVADKYSIPTLMKLAATKFAARAKDEWKTPAFAEAMKEVYTTAADPEHELRNTILAIATKYANDLAVNDFGAPFRMAAKSIPNCGGDLFEELARGALSSELIKNRAFYRCPTCSRVFAMSEAEPNNTYAHSENQFSYRYCVYCGNKYTSGAWREREVKDS